MAYTGLDHVQIAAPTGCEDAARAFYGSLLGLTEITKPAALADRGGVWFRIGRHELHIGVDPAFTPAGKAHPGLAVSDVGTLEGLAERLESAGVDVLWAAEDEIPGLTRFHCLDPFGNRLEVLAPAPPTP